MDWRSGMSMKVSLSGKRSGRSLMSAHFGDVSKEACWCRSHVSDGLKLENVAGARNEQDQDTGSGGREKSVQKGN